MMKPFDKGVIPNRAPQSKAASFVETGGAIHSGSAVDSSALHSSE